MTCDQLQEFEIDYFGGGYFHHNMFKDGRLAPTKLNLDIYATSGETMYDIDRLNGGSINTSMAGKRFWKIIDDACAKDIWKWNDKGNVYAQDLKRLSSQMIFPLFSLMSRRYLSAKSLNIVMSDSKLAFNFLYSVYNGSAWFKYFATAMNIYVDKRNITDVNTLMNNMIEERLHVKNKLIIQGGNLMKQHINKINGVPEFKL